MHSTVRKEYAAFRRCHASAPTALSILRGDYYFARFAQALIPIDSVPLVDEYADKLTGSVSRKIDLAAAESHLARISKAGGKRMRPKLAACCAELGGGDAPGCEHLLSMIEMMHTASLIHDDAVDRAATRRNVPTINAVLGAAEAVQCGDLMLAKAMRLLKHYRGTGINERLVKAALKMSAGELRQQRIRYDLAAQDVPGYLKRIHAKTAELMAASCMCGAIAGGLAPEKAAALEAYGENLGMAFQIIDDIADFTGEGQGAGKPRGGDVKNGIYTLPLLILLNNKSIPQEILSLLGTPELTEAGTEKVCDFVIGTKAVKLAGDEADRYKDKAIEAIAAFPDSGEKRRLMETVRRI
jgi:geranylgeranyl pyrophosphate synthase